ncbi:MAG: FecR domain-containing protein [Pseudomonadota bacterium]
MRRLAKTSSLSALALAVVLGAAPQVSFAATEIGSVAAANRDIEGTPPNASTRSLLIGDRLIANERLVSSPDGSGQMIFLDQTTLTVSPNSEIVLDKYVYDPEADSGELGLTVTRGVMRLVGGRITKSSDAVINTPSATIGIRGGIGLVVVRESGDIEVMHVAGETTTIEANGETLTISRSNGWATVSKGGVPVYQGVAPEDYIAGLYSQMQGGGGGSDEDLDEADAEESGLSDLNSEDPDAVVDEPISTSGESAADDDTADIEQLTIVSDPDIQLDIQEENNADDDVDDEVETEDPFAAFIGGLILTDDDPFTDASGALIQNPRAVNLLFTDNEETATFAQGSLIVTLEEGGSITFPDPEAGFFLFGPEGTASPEGPITGRGFGDPDEGVIHYFVETAQGGTGAVFGGNPGPTQLRTINANTNAFRATEFNILRDLAFDNLPNAQAFLPEFLRDDFNGGTQARLFLVNPPNSNTFGGGTGPDSSRGSKWLLTQFVIQGEGANQDFLLHVGAQDVLNNGANS